MKSDPIYILHKGGPWVEVTPKPITLARDNAKPRPDAELEAFRAMVRRVVDRVNAQR